MATPQVYQQNSVLPFQVAESPRTITGLSNLFEAAIINNQFCQLLLSKPQKAIKQGYLGNSFELTPEEQNLIISINAKSLSDLAHQVTKALM
jgi:hypothetical protein